MHAQRVGDDRLDDVAVSTRQPQRVAAVLLGQPRVVLTDRGDGAGLHLGQPLAAGEHRRAGMRLDHRPQRLLDQLAELAAGPFAVVDLGEPVVDVDLDAERCGERLDGLPASQQRGAHHRADRQLTDPIDQSRGLLAALVVELDALGPAGQHVRGVGGGPAVPQQDDGHSALTAPVASRISTPTPAATR